MRFVRRESEREKESCICISRRLDAGGGSTTRYANLNSPYWKTRKITVLFRNKTSNCLHAPPHFRLPIHTHVSHTWISARKIIPRIFFSPRAELTTLMLRSEEKKTRRNNAIARCRSGIGVKYPPRALFLRPYRIDLDFPTRQRCIISALSSAGE